MRDVSHCAIDLFGSNNLEDFLMRLVLPACLTVFLLLGCNAPSAEDDPETPAENVGEEPTEDESGGEGQSCFENGNCLPGLLCSSENICVVPGIIDGGTGASDGSSDGTGDGTSSGSSDGSGDGSSDGFADFFGSGDADAGPTETVGWGEMCGSFLTPGPACEEGLICGLLTGVCEELCDAPGTCTNCCPISGTGYCEGGLLFSFCQWENGAPPVAEMDAGWQPADAGAAAEDAGTASAATDGGTSAPGTDAGTATSATDGGSSNTVTDAGTSQAPHAGQDAGTVAPSPADGGPGHSSETGGGMEAPSGDAGTVQLSYCEEVMVHPYFDTSSYEDCDHDTQDWEACTATGGVAGFRRCGYVHVAPDAIADIWSPCEEACTDGEHESYRACTLEGVAGKQFCDGHYAYPTDNYVWGTCVPDECVPCSVGETKPCGEDTPYPNTLQECIIDNGIPKWFDGDCWT